MENFLTRRLPEGIVTRSGFYPVHTDFKRWIAAGELMGRSDLHESERLVRIFELCYILLPPSIPEAISGVIDFYTRGSSTSYSSSKRLFSLSHDGELIYAAFMAQYGIDLKSDELHWWSFLALFSGLCGEHKLFNVMKYRAVSPLDIKDAEMRSEIRRLKRLYALPDDRSAEEKDEEAARELAKLF